MSHNERDRPIPVPTNPAPSVPRGSASLSERSSRPTQPDYAAAPVLPHTNHCGSPYRPVRRSLACSVSDGRPARHTGSRTSISAAPRRTARRPALLCCAGRRWRSRAPALLALRWRARARGPSESMRLTTSRALTPRADDRLTDSQSHRLTDLEIQRPKDSGTDKLTDSQTT